MSIPLPYLIALLIGAAVALLWLGSRLSGREKPPSFSPSNDLERLLLASVGETEVTEEMRKRLASATLLGLENTEEATGPMTFSMTFHPDLVDSLEGYELNEEGKIQFGPWVVCFSSSGVVDGLAADPLMGRLVTQVGRIREFPAREIFQSARDQEIDVVLNPFFGVGRRFSQEEIRQLLDQNVEQA